MTENTRQSVPQKRRNVTLACADCRERKRRCDGKQPICGPCAKRTPRPPCIFTVDTLKRGNSSYVESLRARIRELEEKCAEVVPTPLSTTTEPFIQASTAEHQAQAGLHYSNDELLDPDELRTIQQHPFGPFPSGYEFGEQLQIVTSKTAISNDVQSTKLSGFVVENCALTMPVPSTKGNGDYREYNDAGIEAMVPQGESAAPKSNELRNQSLDYFGPSSADAFMSQVQLAIGKKGNGFPGTVLREQTPRTGALPDIPSRFSAVSRSTKGKFSSNCLGGGALHRAIEFSVPARRDADALIESYWTGVHTIYPFLHRASFERKYRKIWELETVLSDEATLSFDDTRLFYCLLNAVLALGSHFNSSFDVRERVAMSKVFYERLKRLLNFDLIGRGSVELVQTLLLMAQYLQSTEMSGLCWNTIGLAIRVAQSIGLHLETSCSFQGDAVGGEVGEHEVTSAVETEIRRRVWGGCVTLDRVLSMVYGRPLMIQPTITRNMVLPSVIDDDALETSHTDDLEAQRDSPCQMAFYIHSLKILHILGEILDAFYSRGSESELQMEQMTQVKTCGSSDKAKTGTFQKLASLDAALLKWRKELPPYLLMEYHDHDMNQSPIDSQPPQWRNSLSSAKVSVFRRQARILQARYLQMRLFLLRPQLLDLYDDDSRTCHHDQTHETSIDSMVHRDILVRASNTCVSVAQELTDVVGDALDTGHEGSYSWWYNIGYMYTSAQVLHVGRLCPSIQDRCGEISLARSWKKCLQCLDRYGSQVESARTCYKALKGMEKQAFSPLQGSNTPSPLGHYLKPRCTGAATAGHKDKNMNGARKVQQGSTYLSEDREQRGDWSVANEPLCLNHDVDAQIGWMPDPEDISWLTSMPLMPDWDEQ